MKYMFLMLFLIACGSNKPTQPDAGQDVPDVGVVSEPAPKPEVEISTAVCDDLLVQCNAKLNATVGDKELIESLRSWREYFMFRSNLCEEELDKEKALRGCKKLAPMIYECPNAN